METNVLGLPLKESALLANQLNGLLAGFQIYYQNLRGLHWNIKGKRFFELHLKFEELYNDAQLKIDLIAERILTLGKSPVHTFEDYISLSQVPVGKNISEDIQGVNLIISSLSELLKTERNILQDSAEINDEGTNSMMSDFIKEQEKTIWMMKAWLNETV
jgi:starvation-inducible DNA-binding protein